jgi:hypothetical protein
MDMLFHYMHILATGLLIGKVVLMSFVVAPILARTLDAESFSKVARRLFPAYYLLGLVSAAVALTSLMSLAVLEGGSMLVFAMTLWTGVLASEWVQPVLRDATQQRHARPAEATRAPWACGFGLERVMGAASPAIGIIKFRCADRRADSGGGSRAPKAMRESTD